MTIKTITAPELGGADSVEIIELCIAPNEAVEAEQSLVVLESDKATMDLPSPESGVLKSYLVSLGDRIREGDAIAELEVVDIPTDSVISGEAVTAEVEGAGFTSTDEPAPTEPSVVNVVKSGEQLQQVLLPDMGTKESVEVIDIFVKPGDTVVEDDGIILVETDKASMDIPSPYAGEISSLLVKVGDKINGGDVIAEMMVEAVANAPAILQTESLPQVPSGVTNDDIAAIKADIEAVSQQNLLEEQRQQSPLSQPPSTTFVTESAKSKKDIVYAGPATRALARELGVDLTQVQGSGPKSRILKDDLHRYVKQAVQGGLHSLHGVSPAPEIDFSQFGHIEEVPLSNIQKLTAANMQRSWLTVPHVTQFDDADITDLESFRQSLKEEAKQRNTRLSPLPFILKACAHTLREHPQFNRSLSADGQHFIQKHYVHLGVAVDTPKGLLVPVIRDVDNKGLWEIAEELNALVEKARNGRLTPAEMQGSCFTISSLGAIGGNGFTPIVNTPEVAILGVSKSQIKPQWNGEAFVPKTILPLALSYDHRAINGADCGRFFTHLVKVLSDVRHLVM